MKKQPLLAYFIILILLSAGIIAGVKSLGQPGIMLVQGYMLTPAIAAIITRFFFYEPKFKDANLRFGKWRDYLKFWLAGIGITILSYFIFSLLGSIVWDFSGDTFLQNLSKQFALAGQNMEDNLPPGFTASMMLWLFFVGGLTVFNILPGLITGFGEEFGHRGFVFPLLYKVKPWMGFILGGLLWYCWHLPLTIVAPSVTTSYTTVQIILNHGVLALGSICTFTYLAYVYVKSRSIFVTSLAHIILNNSATSFSYFVEVNNQLLANIGLAITMAIVVAILYLSNELSVFQEHITRAETRSSFHV